MKSIALSVAAFLLGATCLMAQSEPPTPPPPPPPPHHMDDHMMGMHHDMQNQAAKMRATLEKMKANLPDITDSALRRQAELNVDLWEQMVQHMEGMAKMMSGHPGMGMKHDDHGMDHHDMDHHNMPNGDQPAPPPADKP